MKPSTIAVAVFGLLIIVLSSAMALAWTPQWGPVANSQTGFYYAGYAGNGFQTASTRASWNVVAPQQQMQSYGGWGNSLGTRYGTVGARAERTGPYLTSYGDTALAYPVARYQDPVFRGEFNAYNGRYYNTFSGQVQNQNPYQPMNIRARSYPEPRYVTSEWR